MKNQATTVHNFPNTYNINRYPIAFPAYVYINNLAVYGHDTKSTAPRKPKTTNKRNTVSLNGCIYAV